MMKTLKKALAGLLVLGIAGVGAMGCNTVHGAGRDIEKGGQAIERAADNAKHSGSTQKTSQIKSEQGY